MSLDSVIDSDEWGDKAVKKNPKMIAILDSISAI